MNFVAVIDLIGLLLCVGIVARLYATRKRLR